MPAEAFFKLEKEKQNILLKSAVKEFSSLPYAKVSVFKIAQNAQVSRSGFYYYFKDKADIYQYLILRIKEEFLTGLEKNKKYDIFSFYRKIFDFVASFKGTERESFFRQIMANMRPEDLKDFFAKMEFCTSQGHFEYLCDLENLDLVSSSELMALNWMLISGTMYALQHYLEGEEDRNTALSKQEQVFRIVKYGILREKKGTGGDLC